MNNTPTPCDWQKAYYLLEKQLRRIEHDRDELQRELEQARAYADKLAAALPVGMLPKDVENLRDANAHFAQQVFDFEKEISEAWHILSVLSSNLLDDGPTWPRALEWLDRNKKFSFSANLACEWETNVGGGIFCDAPAEYGWNGKALCQLHDDHLKRRFGAIISKQNASVEARQQ